MDHFKTFIKRNKSTINKELQTIFARLKEDADAVDPAVKDSIVKMEDYCLRGGKRIRAMLTILTHELFEGSCDHVVTIAAAVELIHAFLLIHDDIMDNSNIRRGKPTLHKLFEVAALTDRKTDDTKSDVTVPVQEIGTHKALVAGDALLFFAYDILLNLDLPVDTKMLVIRHFNDVLLNTCIGQVIDYDMNTKDTVDESTILQVYSYKTSHYTIRFPLELGAAIAGASKDEIQTLREMAEPLGIAFQLQDDLLDVFSQTSGKERFGDIKEGKKTVLIMYALSHAKSAEAAYIRKHLGNAHVTIKDAEKIADIIESSGAKTYSERMISDLGDRAISTLKNGAVNENARVMLIQFIKMILARDR